MKKLMVTGGGLCSRGQRSEGRDQNVLEGLFPVGKEIGVVK